MRRRVTKSQVAAKNRRYRVLLFDPVLLFWFPPASSFGLADTFLVEYAG